MKKVKHWLQLAVCLAYLGTGSLAASEDAPGQEEQPGKERASDIPKIGLSIDARGAYDILNHYGTAGFGTATIPMIHDIHDRKRVIFGVSSASLSVEKAINYSEGQCVKLVARINLEKQLTMGSMYADFGQFRIGQSSTNFGDPDACGLAGRSAVQVRWRSHISPLLSYVVALERAPDFVIYPEVKEADRSKKRLQPFNNIPCLSANVRYEKERVGHIQVSGLFRLLEHHDKDTLLDVITPAWGVSTGASVHLIPKKTICRIQGIYGQGMGNYMADLSSLSKESNVVYANGGKESTLETLSAWGVGWQLEHDWRPELRSELAYTFVDVLPGREVDDAYQRGHTASCNLYYHFTKHVKVGTEYSFGVRENIGGDWRSAHCVQAVIGFKL